MDSEPPSPPPDRGRDRDRRDRERRPSGLDEAFLAHIPLHMQTTAMSRRRRRHRRPRDTNTNTNNHKSENATATATTTPTPATDPSSHQIRHRDRTHKPSSSNLRKFKTKHNLSKSGKRSLYDLNGNTASFSKHFLGAVDANGVSSTTGDSPLTAARRPRPPGGNDSVSRWLEDHDFRYFADNEDNNGSVPVSSEDDDDDEDDDLLANLEDSDSDSAVSTIASAGSGGFGTATSTGASVFGQAAQPQQTTSLFGGGTTAFGGQQNALPAFGGGATTGQTQTGAFGTQASTASVFGQQNRPTAGIFSSATTTMSPFSTQTQVAGTSIPFNAITGTDTMMKNGAASQINTRHQCITCMKEYENKSLEELRLEDYQLNRKGPQTSMFGATAATNQAQPGTGLFSGIGSSAGGTTPGTSTFGQTSAFGQTSQQTGGGLFSSLNQPKPTGFFGSGATPTSTAFGGGSLGFSFNNNTSQPQTSIFGANNNTATSNTGLGTQSAFSFASQPQQQQQGLSLFGQKSMTTPVSSAPTFGGGFGTTPANTTLNKPLFGGGTTTTFGAGTTAPTFGTGTGSLFSTNAPQQQTKPFTFSTPFSSTAQPSSQPTFGATSTSTFSFSNPVSTPAVNFGGATAPTFGSTGATTGTGSTFGAPLSFSMGSNTQQQQPAAGTGSTFGSGFFSSVNNNPAGTGGTGTGLSLFGSGTTGTSTLGTGFGTGTGLQLQNPQQLQLQQQQQQQQQLMNQRTISFATTPFKDNQLFYNLISNRKVEDMSKPTNPLAQRAYREASRRKTSTSLGPSSSVVTLNISASPAVKNLTFTASTKNNSISKFQIFNGFHDEDFGIGVDILSPKTDVKKLVLKTDNSSASPSNGEGVGLARRASMLVGGGGQQNKSNCQSPLMQQRRTRLTLNSSLNNSYHHGHDNNAADSNRTIDFDNSAIYHDAVPGPSNSNSNNHSGNADVGGSGDHIASTGYSSKRGSEAGGGGDGILNGLASTSGGGLVNDSSGGSICGVVCTRPGYYVRPSLEELDKRVDANGNCIVRGLEVGRQNYGRIKFLEPVNVAKINIDDIVLFRHKEVVVYPDDDNKPALGSGLNVPAEIELERVWPIDKETNELVRNPEKIRALNYEQKLRKACDRLGADFISYNDDQGIWRFNVSHFSKYSCDLEENEEELPPPPNQPPKGGLGGIPQQKIQSQARASMALTGPSSQPGPGGDAPAPSRMSLPPHLSMMKSPLQVRAMPAPPQPIQEASPQPISDVELNPLTPCDTDEEDDDDLDEEEGDEDLDDSVVISRQPALRLSQMPPHQGESLMPKYKPILKDSGSDRSKMMKSVMIMDEFEDGDSSLICDSQPPIKKSKSLRLNMTAEESLAEGFRLKQRLQQPLNATPHHQQHQQTVTVTDIAPRPPPPALVAKEPVEFSTEPMEDLFADVQSKAFTSSLKLKGCPRVCFLPNGHFSTVVQTVGKKGFSAQVKINLVRSYADKQEVAPLSLHSRSVLEKQMQFRLEKEGVLFGDHIKLLRSEITKEDQVPLVTSSFQQELLIWELCDILWPEESITDFWEDHSFLLEQRKRLEEWFRQYAFLLFGPMFDQSDRSVLGLLKKGRVEDASIKALDEGNFWLSALLTSEPHLILDFDEYMDVLEGMPQGTSDIFSLVSGNLLKFSELTPAQIKSMSTSDWLQYFALYLWYKSPVQSELDVPVDRLVREFERMMREIANDEELPLPSGKESSIANLAMHLLKMYSCTGYPLNILLSPRTWTVDTLDYKLVWLLMRDLEEIGYLPEDETYESVCTGYCGMLEAIGMWKWSMFVMNHVAGPDREESNLIPSCQRILERNLKDESSEEENFLVEKLNLDKTQIYSIKSWKSETSRRARNDEALWYFCSLGMWQRAFDVIKRYLESPGAIDLIGDRVPALAKNMRIHLRTLSENQNRIVGWEVHGKMLESYLALKEPDEVQDAMLNFLESVINFVPCDLQQCAFLLDMALSAQKVVQLLISGDEVSDETKEKMKKSLVKFLEIPVPKEYFTGLSTFIDNQFMLLDPEAVANNPNPLFEIERMDQGIM